MIPYKLSKFGKWWIIRSPFVINCFKARFFLDFSILDAKDSILESYAWKNISRAKDIIKRGTVWHISDRQSVCIKVDKWLLDKVYRSSLIPSIPPDAKVSCLIDANIRGLKDDRINQLFLPHEASLILSIPLCLRILANCLIWSHSSSGECNTRSAYELLVFHASTNNASSSNPNQQRDATSS